MGAGYQRYLSRSIQRAAYDYEHDPRVVQLRLEIKALRRELEARDRLIRTLLSRGKRRPKEKVASDAVFA